MLRFVVAKVGFDGHIDLSCGQEQSDNVGIALISSDPQRRVAVVGEFVDICTVSQSLLSRF